MMCGVERAGEVEDQKQKCRQQHERSTQDVPGDPRHGTGLQKAKHQNQSLRDPLMDAEDSEDSGVEKVGSRKDEGEEISIGQLAVQHADGMEEVMDLVTEGIERGGGQKEGSQIKEYCR